MLAQRVCRTVFLSLILSLPFHGCAAATPAATPKSGANLTPKDYGRLEILMPKTTPHETASTLKFAVRNPYGDVVDGVRVLYRSLAAAAPDAPEAFRLAKRVDLRIAPGEAKEVTLEIPKDRPGVQTFLQAYAVKLGSQPLPLPPQWGSADEGSAAQ